MKSTLLIAWVTVRELVHERVFYLLLTFAALSLGMSYLLGQLTYAEQAKLSLDFLLAAIEISMLLFAIFMGIGLFKRELVTGSVAMVLSKPISRASFVLGKFLGQWLVQTMVTAAMLLVTLVVLWHYGALDRMGAAAQATLLIALEVTVVTSVAYFFAVNAGTITAAVGTVLTFLLGQLRVDLSQAMGPTSEGVVWRVTEAIIPRLEIFNVKPLASYGILVTAGHVGWATCYAACCAFFFLLAASVCFSNKDVLT